MSPNELKILRLALELKLVDKATIARKMGISTGYAQCLLDFLIRHDCLEPVSSLGNSGYVLTAEGRRSFLDSLLQLQAQLQKKIDWLTHQRNLLNERITTLGLGEAEEAEAARPAVTTHRSRR
jgi:hypothetical protein